MGSKQLFDGLSFGVFAGEKIGLIGSNGAGKSTLLKILAQQEKPDIGEVHQQKTLRMAYSAQDIQLIESNNILEYTKNHLMKTCSMDAIEAEVQAAVFLSQAGFEDLEQGTEKLSGGWKKRLSICLAIAQEPDLLILDEPTNHMDWDGIFWLESWLKSYQGSLLLVSHDRAFLSNCTNRILEISRVYPGGYLAFNCNYDEFLLKKAEFIEGQLSQQASMENKARRELEWLRAGVKARTTKSRSRADRAHQLLDNLQELKSRNSVTREKSRIELDSDGRKTKKLVELKAFDLAYDANPLISDLNLIFGPKSCWGILGKNGSGKTSLLRAIQGKNNHFKGAINLADNLKIIYFDQKREDLPQNINLVQYLGDGSDYVIFRNISTHVASYATRFLFQSEKMHLKISQLSGGEQARLLIAKLLLQPADVLILDEPTNDLDIETIEVLEQSLSEFEGLVLLVSHDRYFLNNLCDRFLALKGNGDWAEYAEVEQWIREGSKPAKVKNEDKPKKKSSNKDKKQADKIEKEIHALEEEIKANKKKLLDPKLATNVDELMKCSELIAQQESQLLALYEGWEQYQ